MLDPAAAARELERTVREHGFLGALINSNINGRYFDDKFFWPVFECAESLGVPIYLHPQMPPKAVVDTYYSGFAPEVSTFLSIAGVGWHIDAGIHCIRLIMGGVFDRFPGLQIIAGHNFEILSWAAWRMDYGFPLKKNGGLKRTIKEYLRENFYGGILPGEYMNQAPGAMDLRRLHEEHREAANTLRLQIHEVGEQNVESARARGEDGFGFLHSRVLALRGVQ